MRFIAHPYEVEIVIDGGSVRLPVFNAEGIFKSVKLDELKTKIHDILKVSMEESEKFRGLSEEDQKDANKINKLFDINKKLKIATAEYIRECVKDIEKHENIIDEITPALMGDFQTALEKSMFGRSDEEAKKKISGSTTLKNSAGGATQRKTSRRGRRSNSITNSS